MNLPMHHPLTMRDLRPYSRGNKYCRPIPEVNLGRIALGAARRQPHWPTLPCEFCWPALITSMLWVGGKASCHCCAINPNRVARLPTIARRDWH